MSQKNDRRMRNIQTPIHRGKSKDYKRKVQKVKKSKLFQNSYEYNYNQVYGLKLYYSKNLK